MEHVAKKRAHRKASMIEIDRYRLCPRCGYFTHESDGVEFCIYCGTQLIDECPKCHEPIYYPNAKFCPVCGERYGK